MRPQRHRGPGPGETTARWRAARRGLHRFAWQIGGRGASPPLPLPLRGIAVACSFPIELSGWRFVHEPVDTQSGRARNGGRARDGARCHREGTLALSRTCSVCRYCAHAAVEWRRSAAPDPFSPMDPQRHWGGRPLPMFAAAVPLPWKRVAEQLVNRTQEVPASAESHVLVSPHAFGPSPVGLFLVLPQ